MSTDAGGEATLTPAGERLLAAASGLFYARGIRAVGVDLIAEEAGTTKKTLYDRFGSKDALVALYLRRRADRWKAYVLRHLDAHASGPGVDRVLAVFDALGEWMDEQDRGCAFVNAYAEIGGTDHPGVAVIRADKQWMRALFERLVSDAAEVGVPGSDVVGAQLHLLYEGAIVATTAGGQQDSLEHARRAARRLLEQ
ncbi:MAG: TetR/AcrR family transcriptional regulator [Nocardioidaceae bacterium]|nr:TetR/AcrR family transcriptional regulator [Nocardioidaceae bacterium]